MTHVRKKLGLCPYRLFSQIFGVQEAAIGLLERLGPLCNSTLQEDVRFKHRVGGAD
jgi:hypothetical protein